MSEKNIIKYFFIISCLIAISFPIMNVKYIIPTFSTLLSENAKDESVRIAEYLSLHLIGNNNELKDLDSYASFLKLAMEEHNLEKIKLFLSNGEVVYSSDSQNIGEINTRNYFHDIVAKGNPYSKVVQKETKTLEGQRLNVDVVETYVPIMSGDRFLGAFEIYYDITRQQGMLQKAVLSFSVISFLLMFSFFVLTGIPLLIVSKRKLEPALDEERNSDRSPLRILIIIIASMFAAEMFIMYAISYFPPLSRLKGAVMDATLLVVIVSPALYYFLFHPLLLHINKGTLSRDKLKIAYDELTQINTRLEKEIVEREKAEEEIIQSQKEWEDTFDIMTDAITIHDIDFNIIKSNKAATKLLDLPFLIGKSVKCHKYYHGTSKPLEGCPSCDCVKTGMPASFELYEPHLKKHIEIRAMPRFDSKKNIIGTIHLVRDITERKDMEAKLELMAVTDELTDLYNRRGFFTMLEQQLKVIKRTKEKAFLIYMDIDNFKNINDTLGHSTGDSALVDTANILKSTYRESDIIARLGGDEFVVFSEGKEGSDVKNAIGRLQVNIDDYNSLKNRGYKLSMSIGIATYNPESPYNIDEFLAEADRSMYKTKRQKKKA